MAVIDRIELSAKSKALKVLNICGIVFLGAWLVGVLWIGEVQGDNIKALLLFLMCWSLIGKIYSADAGLFIEWSAEEVEFKTHKGAGSVRISQLASVDIGLDEIKLGLKNDKIEVIDIARFSEYDVRLKIKEHFRQLQNDLQAAS